MTDEIEKAGEDAFMSGAVYNNPYAINSDEFNCFERGWTQAMKKSAVGLMPPVSNNSEKEFPLLYPREREPVYRPPRAAADPDKAEAYRRRKG